MKTETHPLKLPNQTITLVVELHDDRIGIDALIPCIEFVTTFPPEDVDPIRRWYHEIHDRFRNDSRPVKMDHPVCGFEP